MHGKDIVVPSYEEKLAIIAVFVGVVVEMKLVPLRDTLKLIDALNRFDKV